MEKSTDVSSGRQRDPAKQKRESRAPRREPREQQVEHLLFGHAITADTITLWNPATDPPTEKIVSLMHVQPYRAAVPPDPTAEAPWGWEAREYIRVKLLGSTSMRPCEFTPCFVTPTQRTLGILTIGGVNVGASLVEAGLAKVKRRDPTKNTRAEAADVNKLIALEDRAKAAKLGAWSGESAALHVRDITVVNANENSMKEFLTANKGKTLEAFLVEGCSDGGTVIFGYVVPDAAIVTTQPMLGSTKPVGKWQHVTMRLAGVEPVESEAARGRVFTSKAIVGRVVRIAVVDTPPVNSLPVVTPISSHGTTLQSFLLKDGYATVAVDSARAAGLLESLQEAERAAFESATGVWADATARQGYRPPDATVYTTVANGTLPPAAPAAAATAPTLQSEVPAAPEAKGATRGRGGKRVQANQPASLQPKEHRPSDRSASTASSSNAKSIPSSTSGGAATSNKGEHAQPKGAGTRLSYDRLRELTTTFAHSRHWDEWHSPRNLLFAAFGEIGHLGIAIDNYVDRQSEAHRNECIVRVSELVLYLVRFATKFGVDLATGRDTTPESSWDQTVLVQRAAPPPSATPSKLLTHIQLQLGRVARAVQWWNDHMLLRSFPQPKRETVVESIASTMQLIMQLYGALSPELDVGAALLAQLAANESKYPNTGQDGYPVATV